MEVGVLSTGPMTQLFACGQVDSVDSSQNLLPFETELAKVDHPNRILGRGLIAVPGLGRAFELWVKSRFAHVNRSILPARVVAITGSSAKSTTTLLLAHIMGSHYDVLCQAGHNGLSNAVRIVNKLRPRHDFLVIEAGAGGPGALRLITELLKPDVTIVTMVAMEHKSKFKNIEAVQKEKSELVAGARPDGITVLNGDDSRVLTMRPSHGPRTVTFGMINPDVDFKVSNITSTFPDRLAFTMVWSEGSLQLHTRFAGRHFWLPTAAAVATAIELGVPTALIAERVGSFEPIFERCGVLEVPNGPTFIVDSAKAPWHSIKVAFDVLADARAPRKRIVLGQMSDYSGKNDARYREAYMMAREVADQVIFVGNHSHRSQATADDIEREVFKAFAETRGAYDYLKDTAIPGEIVLIKGSANLHLERLALGFTHDLECWKSACGKPGACLDCSRLCAEGTRKQKNSNLADRLRLADLV